MYSKLCLPHSIVIYCAQLLKFYIGSKGKVHELVHTGDNKRTHWLEIPLGRAGLLLKLLSSSSFRSVCAFLFRAWSTLSFHSL